MSDHLNMSKTLSGLCYIALIFLSSFLLTLPKASLQGAAPFLCLWTQPCDLHWLLDCSIQSFRRVRHFATPWTVALQASLSITNSRHLLKLMSVASVMPSNHLILCRPLLLSPSIFPSIRVFSKVSVLLIRWPRHWSFSFSICSSKEYSGLISFRMDWLDLLAVQGTLKSLLQQPQFKSINSSVLTFLHSPTLTSIHDHWKNHSFDQTDLCWQSNGSAF